ncbi:Fe-S protein assembly co-chaperone HscB [Pedobacter hartonius]|uniref:Molecular chaperone HscB n=1 Tax=Pedobacter hartonius TaxID=425514 RepID=A0A1H4H7C2_9SPHI|nr:Fe-S protein assembly co-chaperone HscB [Pedobacter hartonius]SEB16988.1 molecular chaperone HscB [Pedobacter hartonius]
MNYFERYNLPVSFHPDAALVKLKFYELSRKYHPDFYINYSEEKQEEVLELSTENNMAYHVLSDPQKRLHYILELKGLLAEGENYVLPQDFQMEMKEINEALINLQAEPDVSRLELIRKEMLSIENGIEEELNRLAALFDSLQEDAQEPVLISVKDLYYKKKYLHRINDSLFKLESAL